MKQRPLLLLSCCLLPSLVLGRGGARDPLPSAGLTLFHPLASTTTYLIDNAGAVVHSWPGSYQPGNAVYLLDNGNLLRTIHTAGSVGGSGGGVQELSWDGTLLWDFRYSSSEHLSHHDVERLPNGNLLMIAWEYKSRAEAIAAGRNPAYLQGTIFAPDHIVEVEPSGAAGGTIVWEWHLWDHLVQDFSSQLPNYGVVADHPELIDLNYPPQIANQGDWNHLNAIDYNAELDQILVSSHNQDEIWIIDHSTTTAEAAGHSGGDSGRGGDILYRWGNPHAYGAGTTADQVFFGQHDAQWIDAAAPGGGNILVFNNGLGRPGADHSTVEEVVPPLDGLGGYIYTPGAAYGPAQATWSYAAPNPTDFFSSSISGAQRLPNGNTLICSGTQGWFFEVSETHQLVWEYINTLPSSLNNRVFRAARYQLCSEPSRYCATSPNSNGAGAQIDWTGSTSLATNDLALVVTGASTSMPGIFYFGPGQTQIPFGDGLRCVSGAVFRLPVVWTDASGATSCALDHTNAGSPVAAIDAGQTWNFQFWFRDPPFGGAGFNLSDALEIEFCE